MPSSIGHAGELITADRYPNLAVCCRGVTKSYGTGNTKVDALRGVDLDVRRGEIFMLVGPSGCGKTTLISIIAALLKQDAGDCVVLDRDIRALEPSERARFRGTSISFVFQDFNLLPALNLVDNVAVPLLINGVSRMQAEAKAVELLHKVGLGERTEALPSQLSGGQKQRVAIARALASEPRLIVCDEPTSSLDHQTGHDMMQVLRDEVASPDRAVMVVTHDTRILEFADRIAHMEDGKIIDITDTGGRAWNA